MRARNGIVAAVGLGPILFVAAMILLAAFPRYRDGRGRWGREGPQDDSSAAAYAFFEFAPASGVGMGTACAGTTPTGAKGEVLTFSRASTRSCMKGNETTGIANGDLVTLTTGQPAVMAGGDGTGALGLGVWEARTNVVLRSQEFTNVVWSSAASGIAAPTVTADQAVAPDGTTTAERVQVPAASASQFSLVIQATGTCPVGTDSMSLYVKGNGTSGNLDFTEFDAARHTAACAYVAGSWTLCKLTGFSDATSVGTFEFGSLGPGLGGVGSAADVFVWGAQCEAGATVSPYIPTAGTSATRVAEVADMAIPNLVTTAGVALAGTGVINGAATSPAIPAFAFISGAALSHYISIELTSPGTRVTTECLNPPCSGGTYQGVDVTLGARAVVTRLRTYHTGTLLNACIQGTCNNGRADTYASETFTSVRIGNFGAASQQSNGVIKLLCADTYASGNCRL